MLRLLLSIPRFGKAVDNAVKLRASGNDKGLLAREAFLFSIPRIRTPTHNPTMQSFISEIEDPIVQRDILELNKKILLFREGQIDEERFRSLRLARGVYGQRQPGVQMIRIKVPLGLLTFGQFRGILDICDRYSTGKYHITTRQDIQIHHVRLEDSPALWAELESHDVTLREACGNTVRNITASPLAGLDPKEPFNVLPWADAMWRYFLRNPVCQEMGRKFKIAFSNTEEDSAMAVMHDLGVIPALNSEGRPGFKMLIAGGLGAQPAQADVLFDWVPTDELIPWTEALLRIFDREGERTKRHKARFKFLYQQRGRTALLEALRQERRAVTGPFPEIDHDEIIAPSRASIHDEVAPEGHDRWRQNHVYAQRQKGRFAVGIRVPLGDETTHRTRQLLQALEPLTEGELRLTQSQNILLPHIREENLCAIHRVLKTLGWDALGFESGVDVTACPGTDTCNLAIANSTHLATELEHLLEEEFPHVIQDRSFSVKISGCMNACGQHTMASVGLHGSSIRKDGVVIPAMQILVGGGRRQDGSWRFGKKVIKLPTRRIPEAIRMLLIDHESHQRPHETFADHVESMGDRYFYNLLLPLADVQHAEDHALRIDWGSDTPFVPEIGVGECAGVVIDLVSTLLLEAHEKFEAAEGALSTESWGHAVYHTYAAYIAGAKAVLIQRDLPTNSYADIMAAFDEQVVATGEITLPAGSFTAQTLSYLGGGNRPEFARAFADDCRVFLGDLQRLTAHTNSTQSKAS